MSRQNSFKLFLLIFLLSVPCRAYSQVEQQMSPVKNQRIDMMWSALPRNVVKENFGVRISEKYYAVEVVIGNNTGHDLIIKNIEFTLPTSNQLPKPITLPVAGDAMVSADISNPAQLRRFYNMSFHSNLIIGNNVQVRTAVFIPKSSLNLRDNKTEDARAIAESLGDLVLIAEEISCKDKIITKGEQSPKQ